MPDHHGSNMAVEFGFPKKAEQLVSNSYAGK
jgi:hypothetical protein